MATQAADLEAQNSTVLQCPVCKDEYSFTEHRPKILPCDHTVCKKCIKNMGTDFHCPVCRFHIHRRDLVGMTTNFVALELLEYCAECDQSSGNCNHLITSTEEIGDHSESIRTLHLKDETESNKNTTTHQTYTDSSALDNNHHSYITTEYNPDNEEQNDSGEKTPTTLLDNNDLTTNNPSELLSNTLIKLGKKYSTESIHSVHKSHDSDDDDDDNKNTKSMHNKPINSKSISSMQDLDLDLDCKFNNAFDLTSQKMRQFESHIETVKCTKAEALKDIEAEFEHFTHLMLRRKHLLKNQVLTQYEEKLEQLEEKMEKVTFTTMCLTSLHKHSEIVFSSHNNTEKEEENEEEVSQKLVKLNDNFHKVESEIDELVEQLSENQDCLVKRDGFVYQDHGSDTLEKAITTLGRVKLHDISADNDSMQESCSIEF